MAGEFDKANGRAKEVMGRAVGNHRLEREGKRDRAQGEIKNEVEKAKQRLEHALDEQLLPEDRDDDGGEG